MGQGFESMDDAGAYLQHHGIKGQEWGVRNYQNLDGTWTEAGRLRYGKGGSARNSATDSSSASIDKYYDLKNVKKQATNRIKGLKTATGVSAAGAAAFSGGTALSVVTGIPLCSAVFVPLTAAYAYEAVNSLVSLKDDAKYVESINSKMSELDEFPKDSHEYISSSGMTISPYTPELKEKAYNSTKRIDTFISDIVDWGEALNDDDTTLATLDDVMNYLYKNGYRDRHPELSDIALELELFEFDDTDKKLIADKYIPSVDMTVTNELLNKEYNKYYKKLDGRCYTTKDGSTIVFHKDPNQNWMEYDVNYSEEFKNSNPDFLQRRYLVENAIRDVSENGLSVFDAKSSDQTSKIKSLARQGLTESEIAEKLGISTATVSEAAGGEFGELVKYNK